MVTPENKALVILGGGNRIAATAGFLAEQAPGTYRHVYASGLGAIVGYMVLMGRTDKLPQFIKRLTNRNYYGKDLFNAQGIEKLRYRIERLIRRRRGYLCNYNNLKRLLASFYDSRENWDMFVQGKDMTVEVLNLSEGQAEYRNANSKDYFHFKDLLVATACPRQYMKPVPIQGKQYCAPLVGGQNLLQKALEDGYRDIEIFIHHNFWADTEVARNLLLQGSYEAYQREITAIRLGEVQVRQAITLAEEKKARLVIRSFPGRNAHPTVDFDINHLKWFEQTCERQVLATHFVDFR